jgi:hypothetical protein
MAKSKREQIRQEKREQFADGIHERIIAHLDETRDAREQELYEQLEEQWTDEFEDGLEEDIDAEMEEECV